jgi:RNA polymerase sigma-70 factor (ECF subfamily)
MGEAPDGELVRRARAGEDGAFVALCERHRARLWRIARSFAAEPDAEDLAQEAILRAYRNLRGYAGDAPFGAWLCRIALNVARDHHRSFWRRRVLLQGDTPPIEEGAAPENEIARLEEARRVRRAVATLPGPQRTPIWLHYFEGFSLAEVARLEGAPEATIRSRVRAGLKRLLLALGDLADEETFREGVTARETA